MTQHYTHKNTYYKSKYVLTLFHKNPHILLHCIPLFSNKILFFLSLWNLFSLQGRKSDIVERWQRLYLRLAIRLLLRPIPRHFSRCGAKREAAMLLLQLGHTHSLFFHWLYTWPNTSTPGWSTISGNGAEIVTVAYKKDVCALIYSWHFNSLISKQEMTVTRESFFCGCQVEEKKERDEWCSLFKQTNDIFQPTLRTGKMMGWAHRCNLRQKELNRWRNKRLKEKKQCNVSAACFHYSLVKEDSKHK